MISERTARFCSLITAVMASFVFGLSGYKYDDNILRIFAILLWFGPIPGLFSRACEKSDGDVERTDF